MPKIIDLTQMRFGRLTVIKKIEKPSGSKDRHCLWECLCECGNKTKVRTDKLRNGEVKSCGCYKVEMAVERILGYNHEKLKNEPSEEEIRNRRQRKRIYNIYRKMIERCYNEKNGHYRYYGLKRITVCDDWRKSFESFYKWAMNNNYQDGLSIDRVDVFGNYEPSNCRWTTMKEQANNKRKTVYLLIGDERVTLSNISEVTGIGYRTLWHRRRKGWTTEELLQPLHYRRNAV